MSAPRPEQPVQDEAQHVVISINTHGKHKTAKGKSGRTPSAGDAAAAVAGASAAAAARGLRPGVVLLQEYKWATKTLAAVEAGLGAALPGSQWAHSRNWDGGGGGQRDAVVLFDAARYDGRRLALAGEAVGAYATRFAAARLRYPRGAPTEELLVVCYHGRDNKRGVTGKLGGQVKLGLSTGLVDLALALAAGAPAVVGGDWNMSHVFLAGGLARAPRAGAAAEVAAPPPPGPGSVRLAADAEDGTDEIDYFAALSPLVGGKGSGGARRRVAVGAVERLAHRADHVRDGKFDHDPVLLAFRLEVVPEVAPEVAPGLPLAPAVAPAPAAPAPPPQRQRSGRSFLQRVFGLRSRTVVVSTAPAHGAALDVPGKEAPLDAPATPARSLRAHPISVNSPPSVGSKPPPPVQPKAPQPAAPPPPAKNKGDAAAEARALVHALQGWPAEGNGRYKKTPPPGWWPPGVAWDSKWRSGRVADVAAVHAAAREEQARRAGAG